MGLTLSVTARTRCAKCKAPLPIDGLWTSVRCGACNHPNPVTPEVWALLLETPLAEAGELESDEQRSLQQDHGGHPFSITWRRARAKGRGQRPKGFSEALFPRLAGSSDEGAPPTQALHETLAHRCPSCGAPVEVDGRDRSVRCGGCETSFLLPDPVWERLHPPVAPRPFLLHLDGERAAERPFSFYNVADVVRLPDGDLVIAAEVDGKPALARLSPSLRPRWRRAGLKFDSQTACLTNTPDGRLFLMDPRRHALAVVSAEDGRTLGELGGQEPDGATVHHLDAKGAMDLAVCADGSILLAVARRLVRFDAAGAGVNTWPPATGFFSFLWGTEKPRALYGAGRAPNPPPGSGGLGDPRPHASNPDLPGRMVPAPDGGLVYAPLVGPIVAYDPAGNQRFVWAFDGCMLPMRHRPAFDAAGGLWACLQTGEGASQIWRRAPDGQTTKLATHREYVAQIAPTGPDTAVLFGIGGELWTLADGVIRSTNSAALDRDRYAAEEEPEPDAEGEW